LERDLDQRMPSAAALIDALRAVLSSPAPVVHATPHDEVTTRAQAAAPPLPPQGRPPDDEEVTRLLPHANLEKLEDIELKTFRRDLLPSPPVVPRAQQTRTEVLREPPRPPPVIEVVQEWDLAKTEKWDRSLAPDLFRRNLRLPAWLPQERSKLLLI